MSADFGEQLAFSGIPAPDALGGPATDGTSKAKTTTRKQAKPIGAIEYAQNLPIARVVVEKLPAHLDQLFDYRVPKKFEESAVIGARVKVPFGGQILDGFIAERVQESTHQGRISPVRNVISTTALVSSDALEFYRKVADYYAGSLGDVLRLAVPPRHAGAERACVAKWTEYDAENGTEDSAASIAADTTDIPVATSDALADSTAVDTSAWSLYPAGQAFLNRAKSGQGPRAVWTALPGFGADTLGTVTPSSNTVSTNTVRTDAAGTEPESSKIKSAPGKKPLTTNELPHWTVALAQLASAMRAAGGSVIIVVPAAKDVARVSAALTANNVPEFTWDNPTQWSHVTLTHELSASARFEHYLLATRGLAPVVVGTRAAALTPVPALTLAVCWDDGDSSHQEQHAPNPHTREVLALRSEHSGSALLVGALDRTVHAQSLLANGWAHELSAERAQIRLSAPLTQAFGELDIQRDSGGAQARLPGQVWRDIKTALTRGPVLIQVPRAGYIPYVACARCREAARCTNCNGPLGLGAAGAAPHCNWCGSLAGSWKCAECGFDSVRAIRIGSDRTAEELGRAFPGTTVRVSGAQSKGGVLESVTAKPQLVIATPGAEPFAPSGYVLGVLLDAHLSSGGGGLYAHQEALARWLRAAALVQSREHGGKVTLVGTGAAIPTGGLVRWDPQLVAARELDERATLRMPPMWRVASVTGDRLTVAQFVTDIVLPDGAEVLGPVELAPEDFPAGSHPTLDRVVRAIIRVPLREGRNLARAIKAMSHIASAKRSGNRVSVVLDPKELV